MVGERSGFFQGEYADVVMAEEVRKDCLPECVLVWVFLDTTSSPLSV